MYGPPQMGSGYPFNFAPNQFGDATRLVSIGASLLSSHLTQSQGLQQMQFLPTQNAYDQLRAQQSMQNQMLAMQTASASDRRQVEMMMRGAYTMATGNAPGAQQIAQIRAMSSNTPMAVGVMTQLFGTSAVDQAFGSSGSATAMGNIMSRAGLSMFDPATGALGFSGRSSGIVANEMFNQLYGRDQAAGAMKGVTAGRAAELVEELGYRGLLGRNVGASTDPGAYISQLRTSPDMIQRLAEQSEGIQAIRKAGRQPTQQEMKTAVDNVNQTLASAQTSADVLNSAGGGDILRASQAQVLADKVRGMAGAVKAMEEIFGSEGRPDAPMREIVKRLNALTQGGIANMNGTQLESLVRRTQSLSQATGMSVESIQALSGHAASIADRYNLPRSIVPEATLQSVAFGGGAKHFGGVARNTDVGMSLEELTLADQQLRMSAAGSAGGADIAGVSRLVAEGALDINADTDAARMARAIQAGQTSFRDSSGKTRSVRMTRRERMAMLEQAGVDRDTAEAIISDVRGNAAYQNTELGRKLQYEELSDRFNPIVEQALQDQTKGLGLDSRAVGKDILNNLRGLSSDQINGSVEDFSKAASGVVEKSLRDAMKAKGMSDEEINKRLTPDVVRNVTLQMSGNINNQLRSTGSGYKSLQNVLQLNGDAAFAAAEQVKNQTEADAQLRSALGGMNSQGPLGRMADALKNAKPGDGIGTLIAGFLNAVPKNAAAGDKPTAAVMELLGVIQESENGTLAGETQEERSQLKLAAAGSITALTEGRGDTAQLRSMADAADAKADAAAKRGDNATAEAWRKRAAQLRGISTTAAQVASGEIKPRQFDAPVPENVRAGLADTTTTAFAAAMDASLGGGTPLIPALDTLNSLLSGLPAGGHALNQRTDNKQKQKATDGELKSGDRGQRRITGTLKIEGLTKGVLIAAIDSDDDTPEHGAA